jgi:hypothetical protein
MRILSSTVWNWGLSPLVPGRVRTPGAVLWRRPPRGSCCSVRLGTGQARRRPPWSCGAVAMPPAPGPARGWRPCPHRPSADHPQHRRLLRERGPFLSARACSRASRVDPATARPAEGGIDWEIGVDSRWCALISTRQELEPVCRPRRSRQEGKRAANTRANRLGRAFTPAWRRW